MSHTDLVFEKITIQNFLSIGNVELEFKKSGTCLIQGIVEGSSASDSNGSGKSSIVDALCWCLTDRTLRNSNKDKVVNRFKKKNCFVSIEGRLNNIPIKVVRYRLHEVEKNKVLFFYNGEELTERNDSETNKKIIEILGVSFEELQTNIIFNNTSTKFLELGDTDRKKIFDNIVRSDLYEKCIDRAKNKVKEIEIITNKLILEETQLSSTLDTEQKSLETQTNHKNCWEFEKREKIKKLISELEEIKKKSEEKIIINGEEIKDILVYRELQNNIITNFNTQIEKTMNGDNFLEFENSLKEIRVEKEETNSKIINLTENSEFIELENELRLKRENQNRLKEKYIKIESEIKTNKTIKEMQERKHEEHCKISNEFFNEKQICPTCNQEINTEEAKKKIEQIKRENQIKNIELNEQIISINNIIKKYEEELDKTKIEAISLKEEINSLEEKLNSRKIEIEKCSEGLKEKLKELNRKIEIEEYKIVETKQKVTKEIEKYRLEIQRIQKNIEDIREFEILKENLKQKISFKNEEIKNLEEQNNPFEKLIEDLEIRIKKLIKEKMEKLIEIEKENQKLNVNKYWVKGFKEIKGLLISTITPLMNEKAKEYAMLLTDNEFDINFVTQKENKDGSLKDVFEIEINKVNGGDGYESLSSGEKRRIDLITCFVLDEIKRINSVQNLNVRFYDEIFDTLDEVGIEKTINLLNDVAKTKQCFVVTHKADLKDLFNKKITIIKKEGVSNIYEEE